LYNVSKRGAEVPEDLVIDASCEAVPRERGETGACAFDVRWFDDPDAGDLRNHCGTYPDILNRFVLHQHFPPLLSAVKTRVHALARQHEGIRLIFYCNKGKHRSVAAASLFMRCMEADRRLVCLAGHFHATVLKTACRCRVCYACVDGPRSVLGCEAHNCAARMWQRPA
jgi:hypothetical protein